LSTDDVAQLLARYDEDERYLSVVPGMRREELPWLVRQVDLVGRVGAVIHSRLTALTVDDAAREQVDYFTSLGQSFEWKAYAHDQPPDLVARLAALGFEIDEPEAILVLDLQAVDALPPGSADVRRIETPDELRHVAAVKSRVDRGDSATLVAQLTFELETAPDYLSVYVAFLDDVPAATARIRFPKSSAFASLWGGSTVPELRNRGLYTALLAARLDEARRRGFRYVTVDARHMSRPILEKRGFRLLTYATACMWHG
jgi:GNAT superfamily N-acetyltransferase